MKQPVRLLRRNDGLRRRRPLSLVVTRMTMTMLLLLLLLLFGQGPLVSCWTTTTRAVTTRTTTAKSKRSSTLPSTTTTTTATTTLRMSPFSAAARGSCGPTNPRRSVRPDASGRNGRRGIGRRGHMMPCSASKNPHPHPHAETVAAAADVGRDDDDHAEIRRQPPETQQRETPPQQQQQQPQKGLQPGQDLREAGTATGTSSAGSIRYVIRDVTHAELGGVADVIIKSFYADSSSPWKQLYRMGELNRVQQGYPYSNDRDVHRMYVAVVPEPNPQGTGRLQPKDRVVGFVDIDLREPNRNTGYEYNPRPYLSDLCIDPDYRRIGIASALVRRCEDFCASRNRSAVYIRVERDNGAALAMYTRALGYQEYKWPAGGTNRPPETNNGKEVVLLYKHLAIV